MGRKYGPAPPARALRGLSGVVERALQRRDVEPAHLEHRRRHRDHFERLWPRRAARRTMRAAATSRGTDEEGPPWMEH